MRLSSPLPKNAYLAAMKSQMEGHFEFGSERFTGFFLGNCFYVTYHSGFEWNRRYTNQKNAAMGYVKKTEDGCEVRFWHFRGMLCPMVFLTALMVMEAYVTFLTLFRAPGNMEALMISWGLAFACTVIASLVSAPFESLTEKSEEGRRCLLSLLLDPTDPYANYHKVP